MDKACYRQKLARVQRLINIKMAKACRAVSNEALCILTGQTPITIKIEEAAKLHQLTKGSRKEEVMIEHDTWTKHWLHPAVTTTILSNTKDDASSIQIFTDGSRSEQGVCAGIVILRPGIPTQTLKYRLHTRCTNIKAQQLAILKSLEFTETIKAEDKDGHRKHRQSSDTGSTQKQHTYFYHRSNKTQSDGEGNDRMENSLPLGEGTRWDPGKRASRQTG